MRKTKKILYACILFIIILTNRAFATDLEIEEALYSELYEEYLQLTDEEQAEVSLEPRKYDIKNDISSTNEALLSNERITVKNMINLLRTDASISDTKFSLKDIIANNVSIRNQYNTGICWTFASLSSLETNLALQNYYNNLDETIYDYSERHMGYAKTQTYSDKTNKYGFDCTVSDGGNLYMATAYFANGQGAVLESNLPFEDNEEKIESSSVEGLDADTTVNSIIWFDSVNLFSSSTTDEEIADLQEAIKEHIINYGSVYAGINANDYYVNFKTGGIYNSTTATANHAISIIGWDDDYSTDNFNTSPTSNGAWIIRNSWGETLEKTFEELGEETGETVTSENISTLMQNLDEVYDYYIDYDNEKVVIYMGTSDEEGYGYFYVSYEDATIYTNCYGIVSVDDEKTYDNIYQLDEVGLTGAQHLLASSAYNTCLANVFTRDTTETEYLISVGITSPESGTYEVYINDDGTSKAESDLSQAILADGSNQITLTAGYNTIELKSAYELTGTNFTIVLKLIADGEVANYGLEYPIDDCASVASSSAGESFVTLDYSGGFESDTWIDISDPDSDNYGGNLCIKGITTLSYSGTLANASDDSGTGSTEDGGKTEDVVNSDYSEAEAILTDFNYDSSTKYDMTIEITGIEVEDEDEVYEQYFYISSDSNLDTDDISEWVSVSSFEKQDDGTYTITLVADQDTFEDGIDLTADNLYVYIKEVATKDSSTSTYVTNGLSITSYTSSIDNGSSGTSGSDKTNTSATSSKTTNSKSTSSTGTNTSTATGVLPYTGLKTLATFLVITLIVGLIVISVVVRCKYLKYKDI